ncbi:MAG: archaeosortase A [Methanosarcinales archaeon Met12]|nr:MAG: archaeosortase A [Methanosarcinales archaeon Met12]
MIIQNVLWISLGLLLVASIVRKRKFSFLIGALGWMFFAIHWALEPQHYLDIGDVFNAVLTFLVSIFCIFIAFFNIQAYSGRKLDRELDVLHTITFATVIGGTFYFLFSEIPILNSLLIEAVAGHTVFWLNFLGVPAVQYQRYFIGIYPDIPLVKMVLACTGIESMALFAGVTLGIGASIGRKFKAFVVSVPVIYALNIFRNMFVVVAIGYHWFGMDSYHIAHNVLAKIGSTIALFLIAYAVIRILPELTDVITGVVQMFRDIRGVS